VMSAIEKSFDDIPISAPFIMTSLAAILERLN
jgi:hypothetical protein